jgi:DNA-binding MarR family transcriptional regulator
MPRDSVDGHVEHWKREIPGLDPLVEGVFTRMHMLLRHLKKTRQTKLAAHGLEDYEYATLHFLGGCGPGHRATPSEIAAWQRMSPAGITGRLDALENRGFIRRIPALTDRRKIIVELTAEGRKAWLSTFNPQSNEEANLIAALDRAEQKQLDRILRQMMRAIDRPGLLNTPTSDESGNASAERSRFTPD